MTAQLLTEPSIQRSESCQGTTQVQAAHQKCSVHNSSQTSRGTQHSQSAQFAQLTNSQVVDSHDKRLLAARSGRRCVRCSGRLRRRRWCRLRVPAAASARHKLVCEPGHRVWHVPKRIAQLWPEAADTGSSSSGGASSSNGGQQVCQLCRMYLRWMCLGGPLCRCSRVGV
jgi:hypothetical protein